VCLCVHTHISFSDCLNQSYETWSVFYSTWAHLNGVFRKSLSSVDVYIYIYISPHIITKQRLDRHVPAPTNTSNDRRSFGHVVFSAVRIVSKESLWVCLSSVVARELLGKTFSQQRRIVGGIVFYTVFALSKEIRRLILPRTSCYYLY
jgi:hypothetical protein